MKFLHLISSTLCWFQGNFSDWKIDRMTFFKTSEWDKIKGRTKVKNNETDKMWMLLLLKNFHIYFHSLTVVYNNIRSIYFFQQRQMLNKNFCVRIFISLDTLEFKNKIEEIFLGFLIFNSSEREKVRGDEAEKENTQILAEWNLNLRKEDVQKEENFSTSLFYFISLLIMQLKLK